MSNQLIKKNHVEGYKNVFPKTFTDAIRDKESGVSLQEILRGFNMYFLSYNGNKPLTRCKVPSSIRKEGLWITYVLYDHTVVTEWYNSDNIDDDSWGNDSNWRAGSNALVGDVSISADGYWVINGEKTEFKAQGDPGITPLIRFGENNKFQISYTEGKTWQDLSNSFTSNVRISKYIGINESLPTSGIDEGTIYMKGPYYDENDSLNENPIYRMWVYSWKGNTLAWQDNGEFTSISAGVVQERGTSTTEVMSQDAVTRELTELEHKIGGIDYTTYSLTLDNLVKGGIKSSTGKYDDNKYSPTRGCVLSYLNVEGYERVNFSGVIWHESTIALGCAFYSDENEDSFIEGLRYKHDVSLSESTTVDMTLNIPKGAKFFRFTYLLSDVDNIFCRVISGNNIAETIDIIKKAKVIEATQNIGDLNVEVKDLQFELSNGAVTGSTGANASSSNFQRTNFIDIIGYEKVEMLGFISPLKFLAFGYAFYDENQNYITGKRLGVDTSLEVPIGKKYLLNIPENAHYFRTCIYNSLAEGMYIRGVNGNTITERLNTIEKGTELPRVKFEFSHKLMSPDYIANIINGIDTVPKNIDGNSVSDIMWQLYAKFDALMEKYPNLITKMDLVGSGIVNFEVDDLVEKDGILYRCVNQCDDTEWIADNFTLATGIDAKKVRHKYFGYPVYARLNGVAQDDYTYPCPNYNTYMYKIASANEYAGNKEGGNFPKKKMLIVGAAHGIEIAGAINTYILACSLCEPKEFDVFALHQAYDIYIIPVLNGYGTYARTRYNANNVDINRNYPIIRWRSSGEGTQTFTGYAAASEFETNIIMALCEYIKFDIAIGHHNYWPNLPKQYYVNVANAKLMPLTYQSLTDISYAFINAYPQYFGTTPKLLLEDKESAPGVGAILTKGTHVVWWYESGIEVCATIEICTSIAYNNGIPIRDGDRGIDTYGSDFFSTAHYSLLNQLCRFAEFDLQHQ